MRQDFFLEKSRTDGDVHTRQCLTHTSHCHWKYNYEGGMLINHRGGKGERKAKGQDMCLGWWSRFILTQGGPTWLQRAKMSMKDMGERVESTHTHTRTHTHEWRARQRAGEWEAKMLALRKGPRQWSIMERETMRPTDTSSLSFWVNGLGELQICPVCLVQYLSWSYILAFQWKHFSKILTFQWNDRIYPSDWYPFLNTHHDVQSMLTAEAEAELVWDWKSSQHFCGLNMQLGSH